MATSILAAVFFGCRPCSLFDTRIKFDDSNDSDEPLETVAVIKTAKSRQKLDEAKDNSGYHRKRRHDGDTITTVDSGCHINSDPSTVSDENSKGDSDSDSDSESNNWRGNDYDSDSSSICTNDEDLDTDDECDTGPEETRSFLYRHITISIVANETPGEPNLVFLKATLLHTKGENNHPRV